MGTLPQLFMRKPRMDDLPPLALPKGFSLHSHTEGMDPIWESIIEKAFGSHFVFDSFIRNGGGYKPEYVLYIAKDGVDIATTTAIEKADFPGEGWFRMVATVPEARGQGAGHLVVLAALHSLAARGYSSVVLSTDDARLPAIRLYRSFGFEPLMTHESHPARWDAVLKAIGEK